MPTTAESVQRKIALAEKQLAKLKAEYEALQVPPPVNTIHSAKPKPTKKVLAKVPQAFAGVVVSPSGKDMALHGKAHKELAATHKEVRDHADWSKYYDKESNKFVSKSFKEKGAPLPKYKHDIENGVIEPPRGHYYNMRTKNLVHEHTVFTPKDKLRPAFADRSIHGRIIKGAEDNEISVICYLFEPIMFDDEPMKEKEFKEHRDISLKHVKDQDGNYHQEIGAMPVTTTEAALAQWLPEGRMWWVNNSQFKDYVQMNTVLGSAISKAKSARPHKYETLGERINVLSNLHANGGSGITLSGFCFKEVVKHDNTPAYDALMLKHHGAPRGLYAPILDAGVNPAAVRLEDWLLLDYDAASDKYCKARPGAVAMPKGTGCGYDFIIKTYAPGFLKCQQHKDKSNPQGRYRGVEMTPQWLYENIFHKGESYDEDNLGLSVLELRQFFEEYRLSLYVLDITGRMVEELCYAPPTTQNTHLTPASSYILIHNEHVYPIDSPAMRNKLKGLREDCNSFIWKPLKVDESLNVADVVEKAPTSKYNIRDDDAPVFFIRDMDALASLNLRVQKTNRKGELRKTPVYHDRIRVAIPASLPVLLKDFHDRLAYEPKVSLNTLGEIQSLTLKADGIKISISAPQFLVPEVVDENHARPHLPNAEVFALYCKHDYKYKNALRSSLTLSQYSESLTRAFYFKTAPKGSPFLYRSPLQYSTDEYYKGPITAIDRSKSYTSLLMEMKKVPVFNEFCEFEPYEYNIRDKMRAFSERDSYGFYLVHRCGMLFAEDPRYLLLDQEYCLITFQTWLHVRDWSCCATLGRILPFSLIKTNIRKITFDMWKSDLPVDIKKFIPNKHWGCCGKKENVRSDTLTFTSYSEACAKKRDMGDDAARIVALMLGDKKYYFLTREWKSSLSEGFMPIHHAVLDGQRRVLYEKAVEIGKPVLAVKTDCLFYKGHNIAEFSSKRNSFDSIGTWHVYKENNDEKVPTNPPYIR